MPIPCKYFVTQLRKAATDRGGCDQAVENFSDENEYSQVRRLKTNKVSNDIEIKNQVEALG